MKSLSNRPVAGEILSHMMLVLVIPFDQQFLGWDEQRYVLAVEFEHVHGGNLLRDRHNALMSSKVRMFVQLLLGIISLIVNSSTEQLMSWQARLTSSKNIFKNPPQVTTSVDEEPLSALVVHVDHVVTCARDVLDFDAREVFDIVRIVQIVGSDEVPRIGSHGE